MASRQASRLAELEAVLQDHDSLKTLASSQASKLSQLQTSEKALLQEVQRLSRDIAAYKAALSQARSSSAHNYAQVVAALDVAEKSKAAKTRELNSVYTRYQSMALELSNLRIECLRLPGLSTELRSTQSELASLKSSYKRQTKELAELRAANQASGCSIQ